MRLVAGGGSYAVLAAAVYVILPIAALVLLPAPPLGFMPAPQAVHGRGGSPLFYGSLLHGALAARYAGMGHGEGTLSLGPVLGWGAYVLTGADMGRARAVWAWHARLAGDGRLATATIGAPLARVGDVALTLAVPLIAAPLLAAACGRWFGRLRPDDLPDRVLREQRRPFMTEARIVAAWYARSLPAAAGAVTACRLAGGLVQPLSLARHDALPDMLWIGGLALAGAAAMSIRDRFNHAQRQFQGERAACACGYLIGEAAVCPECGRPRGGATSYYQSRQRRFTRPLLVAACLLGPSLLAASLLVRRAAMHDDIRRGIVLAPIERAHAAPASAQQCYLRVPANAALHISAGSETHELRIRSRFSLQGPMVHLDPDRHFATGADGILELHAPTPPGSQPVNQTTAFTFSRYGPVNTITTIRVGRLRITAGIELENLGCVGLLISDVQGGAIRAEVVLPEPGASETPPDSDP